MDIGKLGVFSFLDTMTAKEVANFARRVEKLGYGALWYPEAVGRNSFVQAGWILANTEKLVAASGIANIYARDAQATHAGRLALNELSGDRFLLGLGVSHAPLVQGVRGHDYSKPLEYMRNYLGLMARAVYQAPAPPGRTEVVLAALGPKMLELAGRAADGAHPYSVTPEHTAQRKILGPEKRLYVEQKVLLESDPQRAREIAKATLGFYLGLPNYRNNWFSLGFTEEDMAPSDRFLDAMVAWGDEEAIRARLDQHFQAGADHVCIQPLGDLRVLEVLA